MTYNAPPPVPGVGGINKLPAELTMMIANNITDAKTAFRFCLCLSQRIRRDTEQLFARKWLRKRLFVLNKAGLRCLLAFANDKRWRPYLQHVILVLGFPVLPPRRLTRSKRRELPPIYRAETYSDLESGAVTRQLIEAFNFLRRRTDLIVEVASTSQYLEDESLLGSNTKLTLASVDEAENLAMRSVCDALAIAQCAPQEFRITNHNNTAEKCLFKIFRLSRWPPQPVNLLGLAFGGLKRLAIDLQTDRSYKYVVGQMLGLLFNATRMLEDLEINYVFQGDMPDMCIWAGSMPDRFSNLKRLSLAGLVMWLHDDQHSTLTNLRHLEILTLDSTMLVEKWTHFLREMEARTSILTLSITNPCGDGIFNLGPNLKSGMKDACYWVRPPYTEVFEGVIFRRPSAKAAFDPPIKDWAVVGRGEELVNGATIRQNNLLA